MHSLGVFFFLRASLQADRDSLPTTPARPTKKEAADEEEHRSDGRGRITTFFSRRAKSAA